MDQDMIRLLFSIANFALNGRGRMRIVMFELNNNILIDKISVWAFDVWCIVNRQETNVETLFGQQNSRFNIPGCFVRGMRNVHFYISARWLGFALAQI